MSGTFAFFKNTKIIVISTIGTMIGAGCLIKDNMQGGKFKNPISAEGKVIIITGCNTGIGRETVQDLANRKAKVYMACRDLKKCEETREEIVLESKNKHVYCRECDLASFESIRQFVENFQKSETKLDVLINNAGVMRCPRSLTKDGIEMQLGVNHMGHFLLTGLLINMLKSSAPSRIINVSSLAHTRGEINVIDLNSEHAYDEGKAYSQSKLANILFTVELAQKLKNTGVTVNCLHPGIVDTEIMRHMSIFNSFLAKIFIRPFMWPFLKTPISGAQTTLYTALDPELEKTTGQYFSDCEPTETAEPAKDSFMAKWLWAVSEKWTHISY